MSYTKSQLQHQKELEVARERIRNRKKRTRRLIQFGAIAESFFPGSDRLTPEEFQNLLSSRLFPMVEKGADVSFLFMSAMVFRNVTTVLVVPLLLALLSRKFLPKWVDKVTSKDCC